ncbi:MAG: peptide ABC transporter substrate-binding protein [Clostridia bacterium]|nr:peptide ABC transporter substrate-binding protein [Clostridia bacterium]
MKKLICALLAAAMLFSLTSCLGRGTGKSITYAIDASPSTLDPQYASETGAEIIINNVFEGLVRLDSEGNVIPGIAEKWEISKDGLTYTFKLREGTEWYCPSSFKTQYGDDFYNKFVDEKVRAADFVYACRRTVDPAIQSPSAVRMMVISGASEIYSGKADMNTLGVAAPDDTTLIFHLTEPCDDFLSRLTESEFMPCNEEFFKAMKGRYGLTKNSLLCNGPFYLSYWNPEKDGQVTIKKNKYYAGTQAVQPVSVQISFDADGESIYKKLANGSLSASLLGPMSDVPEGVSIAKEIPDTVIGIAFNCDDPVLANANIRKALCSSVDLSLFKEDDTFNKANGFIPGSCYAGVQTYRDRIGEQTPSIKHSSKAAGKLWKAGLEELEISSVSLTVLCPDRFDEILREQLQRWQKALGISLAISVENKTDAEIESALNSGNYQMAVSVMTSEESNAVDYLSKFSDGGVFRYDDVNFLAVIKNLQTAATDDELINGCFTAEAMILREGVFFPLLSGSSKFVTSDETSGISILDSENTVCFINTRRFD